MFRWNSAFAKWYGKYPWKRQISESCCLHFSQCYSSTKHVHWWLANIIVYEQSRFELRWFGSNLSQISLQSFMKIKPSPRGNSLTGSWSCNINLYIKMGRGFFKIGAIHSNFVQKVTIYNRSSFHGKSDKMHLSGKYILCLFEHSLCCGRTH